jgi:hypothetical protein
MLLLLLTLWQATGFLLLLLQRASPGYPESWLLPRSCHVFLGCQCIKLSLNGSHNTCVFEAGGRRCINGWGGAGVRGCPKGQEERMYTMQQVYIFNHRSNSAWLMALSISMAPNHSI